jgi:hypothetical protein
MEPLPFSEIFTEQMIDFLSLLQLKEWVASLRRGAGARRG